MSYNLIVHSETYIGQDNSPMKPITVLIDTNPLNLANATVHATIFSGTSWNKLDPVVQKEMQKSAV